MDAQPTNLSHKRDEGIVSPKKKRKNKSFSQTEKDMILNAYKYVIEKEAESPIQAPKKNECGFENCQCSPKKSGLKSDFKDKLNDYTFSAIRQKVHAFVNRNELPTLNKVLQVVNDDPELPSFSRSSLYKILKHLQVLDQETQQCNNA